MHMRHNMRHIAIRCFAAWFLMVCYAAQAQMAPAPGQGAGTNAWSGQPPRPLGQGVGVRAGSAVLDIALATIIPAPYQVRVDSSIPKTAVLTWSDHGDWMSALRQAAAPMGIRILPNWENNTIALQAAPTVQAPAAPPPISAPVAPTQVTTPVNRSATALVSMQPGVIASRAFRLDTNDRNVRTAFTRWAQSRGTTVQWLLNDDAPIDASGEVRNTYDDMPSSQFAGYRVPELIEAMTVVARSFGRSRTPFVIREYDNTIVVMPRSGARP